MKYSLRKLRDCFFCRKEYSTAKLLNRYLNYATTSAASQMLLIVVAFYFVIPILLAVQSFPSLLSNFLLPRERNKFNDYYWLANTSFVSVGVKISFRLLLKLYFSDRKEVEESSLRGME